MATSRTVDAKWTFEHERSWAKSEVMYITGALRADDPLLQGRDHPVEEPVQTAPSDDASQVVKGTCFCGQTQFELPLSLQPIFSAVCHCRDCQEWNMSGSVPSVCFPFDKEEGSDKYRIPLRVTSDISLISYVQRTPVLRRFFTTCCGTRIFFSRCDANIQMWGFFPALFPTWDSPPPTMELCVRESRIHGLKVDAYKDIPTEFGGSGTKVE